MSPRALATLAFITALAVLVGCGDEPSASDAFAVGDSGDTHASGNDATPSDAQGGDGRVSDAVDPGTDATGRDTEQAKDATTACVTDTVTYRTNALACEWDFAGDYDSTVTNVYIESANGVRSQLCRSSRSGCNVSWFSSDGRIVLCDLACLEVEQAAAAGGAVVVEYGCPTESCGGGCIPGGSPCSNETCCVGYHCSSSECRPCGLGGESCNIDAQCCADDCVAGTCVAPLRRACRDTSGCAAGECIAERCTCPTGLTECDGACVDLAVDDPAHCGSCGNTCREDQVCASGSCVCDPALGARTECGGSCVDTNTDVAHCGTCELSCLPDQSCVAGSCECPAGLEVCGGACTDVVTDRAHCGQCDNACAPYEVCESGGCGCAAGLSPCRGTCLDLMTDRANCGTCENVCNGQKICVGGVCVNP